ncbi:MAG: pentapeptide repeat-containing protein [Myxococcota bacterium]
MSPTPSAEVLSQTLSSLKQQMGALQQAGTHLLSLTQAIRASPSSLETLSYLTEQLDMHRTQLRQLQAKFGYIEMEWYVLTHDHTPGARSIEDSWVRLESQGERMPRLEDGTPIVAFRMPSPGDAGPLGFEYFKQYAHGQDNSGLSLPRTFIGRSHLSHIMFVGSCLAQSRMCWNDFTSCDFSGADLSQCDMRASVFVGCTFEGATLHHADLRGSTFEGCSFSGANLSAALADGERAGPTLSLSPQQREAIIWHSSPGEQPPGG